MSTTSSKSRGAVGQTAGYKSLGVRPVFLARTFMAVGPRVTLSW